MEMLDIVNESDQVIGQASREEVHRERYLHRSSHVILADGSGRIFVQLRSATKDNNPGLWDTSAAGHVDSGETYLQCAVRELEEELGIELAAAEFSTHSTLPPSTDNGFEFVTVFFAESDKPLVLQAEEIADGRWVTSEELNTWIRRSPEKFTDVFLTIWQNHTERHHTTA